MLYFPLFFRMTGKKVLVVGGGNIAERKVKQLLEFGAVITLVSPEVVDYIANLADGKKRWNGKRWVNRNPVFDKGDSACSSVAAGPL